MRAFVVVVSALAVATSMVLAACSDSGASDAHHDASYTPFPDAAPDGFVLDAPVLADSSLVDASADSTVSPDAGADADAAPDSAPALTYPQVVRADNPRSYWRLGEAGGSAAVDEMGATNGTYTGTVTRGAPGAIAGDPNPAVTFDGVSGYVGLGNGFAFNGTAAMSLEAWVKPGTLDGQYRRLLSKEIEDGNGRQGYLIAAIADGGGGDFSFERFRDNGTEKIAASLPVGVYSHLVATYDGTTMVLYVNGVAAANVGSTRSLAAIAVPLNLATYSDPAFSPLEFFPGTVDELAIYDHALSAARVLVHYRVGTGM